MKTKSIDLSQVEQVDDTAASPDFPRFNSHAFPCPHCKAFAHQNWLKAYGNGPGPSSRAVSYPVTGVSFSHCVSCNRPAIWWLERLVYPEVITSTPEPFQDMPDDVKADYDEARLVYSRSPRAAGGLLRIGFEKLFPHLGITGKNPNDAIGELVKKGLVLGDEQMALDALRIFSNQTSHDGFVKLEDQPATVLFLFELMNLVVQQQITIPKQVKAMYQKIPQNKLDGIAKRDTVK